jgi:hypothetical protein
MPPLGAVMPKAQTVALGLAYVKLTGTLVCEPTVKVTPTVPTPTGLGGDITVQVVPPVQLTTVPEFAPKLTKPVVVDKFPPVNLTIVPPPAIPVVPAQVPLASVTTQRLVTKGAVFAT